MAGHGHNHVGHALLSMNICLIVLVLVLCGINCIWMNIWLFMNGVDLLVTMISDPRIRVVSILSMTLRSWYLEVLMINH